MKELKKVLYIVSTLRETGPTNQLFGIISNLNKNDYNPVILTLSPNLKILELRILLIMVLK